MTMKPNQYLSPTQTEALSIMAELFDYVQFKNNNVNKSRIWTEEESAKTCHNF